MTRRMYVIAVLATIALVLTGCSSSRSSKDSELTRSRNLTPGQAFLKTYYDHLLSFKDESQFHMVGFSPAYKYHKWQKAIQDQRKKDEFSFDEGVALGHLVQLGSEYMNSKGRETRYGRYARNDIESAIKGE